MALRIPALAILHPEDAAAAGLTAVLVPANKPLHRDATMCQLQAARAAGILILLSARAANQAQPLAQEPAAVPDHAPLDLIG